MSSLSLSMFSAMLKMWMIGYIFNQSLYEKSTGWLIIKIYKLGEQ